MKVVTSSNFGVRAPATSNTTPMAIFTVYRTRDCLFSVFSALQRSQRISPTVTIHTVSGHVVALTSAKVAQVTPTAFSQTAKVLPISFGSEQQVIAPVDRNGTAPAPPNSQTIVWQVCGGIAVDGLNQGPSYRWNALNSSPS